MSKRPSFSDQIGKYFGYLLNSKPNTEEEHKESNNNNTNNKDNHNNMAQASFINHNSNIIQRQQHYINNNNKHRRSRTYKQKHDVFDTKNFDKIDYIVQIPLIDNPNERQSRFLLAMDYTLPPRDGLGIMDTALEHIVHYYDMKKVELIFCEMWKSVCLFIEFHDITSCKNAYNQFFQFFKTIFYVEDLSNLEEIWICANCKHYNQFNDNFCNHHNHNNKQKKRDISIEDIASKRKNSKGDEYVYWCTRCKNVNDPSYKKIKYSYQKLSNRQYAKSQHPQLIASTSAIYPQMVHNNNTNVHKGGNIVDDEDVKQAPSERRTAGTHLVLGQASGSLKFNVPQKPPNPHYRHDSNGSNNSMMNVLSSSPELVSPTNSVSMMTEHNKKYSVDSQASVVSTASNISSIDNNLDLCYSILENIDQETNALKKSNSFVFDVNHNLEQKSNANDHLQQIDVQKQQVLYKISKLSNLLKNIQSTFTSAVDNHKRMINASPNTSPNVIDFQQNQIFSDPEDKYTHSTPQYDDEDIPSETDGKHIHNNNSNDSNNHHLNNIDDDEDNEQDAVLRTPAGADILLGHAHGPLSFNLPAAHIMAHNSNNSNVSNNSNSNGNGQQRVLQGNRHRHHQYNHNNNNQYNNNNHYNYSHHNQ